MNRGTDDVELKIGSYMVMQRDKHSSNSICVLGSSRKGTRLCDLLEALIADTCMWL